MAVNLRLESPEDVAKLWQWLPIHTAPRIAKSVILCLGDTIPDVPYVRTGSFVEGKDAEELGHREYAKYGGWLIFDEDCGSWYMVDHDEPRGWFHLPDLIADSPIIEGWRNPTDEELERVRKRLGNHGPR